MTNGQIRKRVARLRSKLASIKRVQEETLLELKHTQERCSHSDVESWTNNDGDGRFRVNRCRVCGLQKDGPLR